MSLDVFFYLVHHQKNVTRACRKHKKHDIHQSGSLIQWDPRNVKLCEAAQRLFGAAFSILIPLSSQLHVIQFMQVAVADWKRHTVCHVRSQSFTSLLGVTDVLRSTEMIELDGDEERISSQGRYAERDIVQVQRLILKTEMTDINKLLDWPLPICWYTQWRSRASTIMHWVTTTELSCSNLWKADINHKNQASSLNQFLQNRAWIKA